MNKRLPTTIQIWLWLLVLLMAPAARAQVSLTTINAPYSQDFNTLLTSGTANATLPMGFTISETGGGVRDNELYAADNGASNVGDTYSYGSTGDADRAFGGLQSGTLILIIGASFVNNTGTTITALTITYTGEEWRLGTANRADRLDFQYSTNATDLTDGTYTDVDALDFSTPNQTTVGAKNGNDAANRTSITSTITGLSIAPGGTFWIRYTDTNASGADDGMAIDDFSLTPVGAAAPPTVTLSVDTDLATETPAQVVTITATTSGPVTGDQTVTLTPTGSASNGVDYTLSSTVITILDGAMTGSITLTTVDDAISEGSETATLTITSMSDGSVAGNPAAQTITITDNDVPGLTVVQSAGNTTVTEGGATDTYTVVLNSQPTADVIVTLTPDAQVSVGPATFTFTAGNYATPQSVTVTAVDDAVVEGTHSGVIQQAVTSSDPAYNSLAVASVTAVITDNDVVAPVLAANPANLSSFSTATGSASAPQVYTLTGSNLTADVTVSAPAGFQVSTDGTNFLDEVTVGVVSGSVSTTIAVRLTGAAPGTFGGIVNNLSGTASATVAVSGQVTAPAAPVLTVTPATLSGFSTTQGTASAAQTYTLTGSNLTASVSVSAPAGFQVSLDGTTFQDQLTAPVASGSLSATIAVRLTGATAGSPGGNITHVSGSATATVAVSGQVNAPPSTSLYYNLSAAPFTQDWTNTALITADDNWSNVPSIIGYRGDDLTPATGTNPQTILAGTVTPVDVIANQTNPNGLTAGGVAEFELTNPAVALQGSGTADAPHLVVYLNTTNVSNISVAYNLRDLDGSTDNAIQQVALQYRIGESGNFTNLPAAYVNDATTGPSSATQVTAVSVTLPVEAENQPQVQLRIITANASGNDEWVGIDDIVIAGTTVTPTGPTVAIQATDANAAEAGADPGVFTITRTGSTTAALAVNYVVGSGTGQAVNGTDYTPTLTGTATIDAGQTTATIVIMPVDDALVEGNETVVLSLTTGNGYTLSGSRSATVTIADNDVVAGNVRIHDIQGTSHVSVLVNQPVTNVPGIVTVLTSTGFYLEDPIPDADPATSEGIFVFTSSLPGVSVGTAVLVSGTVSEFRPGNNNNLSTTQITSSGITTQSSNNELPGPTVISSAAAPGTRTIPNRVTTNDFVNGDVENSVFDPAEDGLDFFESLEGMRVLINNPLTTGFRTDNGELFVIADNGNGATGKNARNTITISGPDATDINSAITNSDFNPERILIDDLLSGVNSLPDVNVGAVLSSITGVVIYDFQNYRVLPTIAPTVVTPNPATKEVTNLVNNPNQVTIATFNVENLDPGDDPAKFSGLANAIVTNLKAPDIITLEEIQDNNGPAGGGVVDASQTFQTLINAIASAGGPTYQFRQINPVNNTNGGEPEGNIRVGFLFNPARVGFVDRPGGGSTTATTVINVNGQPQLSVSPGLIDPTNSAFSGSRKPLAGEFTFNGQTIFVIGNHFTSRGGSGSLTSRFQPPAQGGQTAREAQAAIVNAFVDQLLAVNTSANVAVMGDFNEFQFFPVLQILEGDVAGQQPVLTNLITTLPVEEQYTYNFDGNAQALDHFLASRGLFNKLAAFDVVHINSEFLDQLSDHDPSLAQFNFAPAATPLALTLTASPTMILTTGTTTLSATVSGGTPSYIYTFVGPGTITPNGNTATVSNLPAGVQTFTVLVADATTPTSQTISATVSVTVSAANTAPTVANVIPPQSATVGQGFSFVIPANTFADTETPGSLVLSVSGLPAGLSFDASTTAITGTPSLTGTSTVTVTATDPGSLSVSTSFTITVSPAPVGNTPPVATANSNQTATVGVVFSYTVNAFTDNETPNNLTYSAVINPPNGLSFDPVTRIISGTPSMSGVSSVTVRATDPGSLSASTSFTITVNPAGTPPTPTSPFAITGVTTVNCSVISAGERSVTFSPQYAGATGQPITFSVVNELAATTAAGPYTLRLYTDNPVITLKATQSGTAGEATFNYNWLAACSSTTPGNTAPTVANAIPPQSATVNQGFSFVIPANTFTDAETPNALVLSVSGLPMGLSFNASTTAITGTPSMTGTSTVTVTATDPGSLSVSTTFTITVNPAGTTPTPTGPFAITGVTTVNCETIAVDQRRLTFNPQYAGANGQPITFSVVNELAATTAAGPYTLRLYTDNPVITLKATQSGTVGEASFSYNWLAACGSTPPTPTGPFAITGVTTVNCETIAVDQRRLTFNPQYAGVNGQPVSFQVVNELAPTTAPGPYTLQLYTDNPVITLKATQSGTAGEASFTYNWLAACNSGARVGTEPVAPLAVRVLGNPVRDGQLTVDVSGGVGQSLTFKLTDASGRLIETRRVDKVGLLETQRFGVSGQSAGVLLLRVSTPNHVQVVKVIKPE